MREQIDYLRRKAAYFRQLATEPRTLLTARLLEVAARLDREADNWEQTCRIPSAARGSAIARSPRADNVVAFSK